MKAMGLKNIRKAFGFTMRELATELDVTANAINIWENGGVDISEGRLETLSGFFGLEKELFIKENHGIRDMMIIEHARAAYKIEKYKSALNLDFRNIIEDKELKDVFLHIDMDEESENLVVLKTLIKKLLKTYSNLNSREYNEFDDYMRNLLDMVNQSESNGWEKFKVIMDSLTYDEDIDNWENDYMLFCDAEQLARKQICDNVESLYLKRMYEKGLYKPEWMDD